MKSKQVGFDAKELENAHVNAMGNIDLLQEAKIAFLSSSITDEWVDWAAIDWVRSLKKNACVMSGFQSRTDRAVLGELLKTEQKIVMVLARKPFKRCPARYKEAVESGRMLIISPLDNCEGVNTKENALRRNEYLLRHAKTITIGCVKPNGILDALVKAQAKPVCVLMQTI